MCKKCQNSSSLDTLAQLRTDPQNVVEKEAFVPLTKKTDFENKVTLVKRAKRKFLATGLALRLVDYCDKNPNEGQLKKSYWNSFYCVNKLAEHGGEVMGEYCKNRWCLVCNSIRQMVLKNKYGETLDSWKEKYFVTLTVPNCSGDKLKETIEGMTKTFAKIKNMFYRRWKRGKGTKLVGLRKLECTYNPQRGDYHPHFHFVLTSESLGQELIDEWLARNPGCNRAAQDIRQADENSTKELFKYFTKIISTHDKEKKIYTHALNTIFNAIKGKRTFQPFGFKAVKITEEEIEENEIILTEQNEQETPYPQLFMWKQEVADWVNEKTGEMLSGHQLSESLQEIVNNKILLDSS